ncbi:MAG TPA: lysophospholipid acyltransferase family protein [Candidatus Polarisedimenticolia bacterium]|nr:lysophospholipid acyltransferase family protein [Candidatus Polarisedimenticolia bacterium]
MRRNLAQIASRNGPDSVRSTFHSFYNFSKFMVSYTEVAPYGDGSIEARIAGGVGGRDLVQQALSGHRGLIVLGMHLGQWDLALISLARLGHPITAVMRREDEEAARFAAAARAAAGIRVAHAGEDPRLMVRLLGTLRRNEIVALQGDRPYGQRSVSVRLFGRETRIAAGPLELARAAGSPILPSALVMEGHRRYRMVFGDLLRVDSVCTPARAYEDGADRVARALESIISCYPNQWFNFYDFWDAPDAGGEMHPARRGNEGRGHA